MTLSDALWQEGAQIHRENWRPACDPQGICSASQLYAEMHRQNQTALCLSGGGIRSAAFALGVMQAFAGCPEKSEPKLIRQFHYLSTVSGGGYIGSWFTAWLSRQEQNGGTSTPASDVIGAMARRDADVEPVQITNLRENTSYITPRAGMLSGDMWAGIATIVRNLLLNWLVVLPLLAFVVLAAKVVAWGVSELRNVQGSTWEIELVALAALAIATAYRIANRPSLKIANWPPSWFYGLHLPLALVSALGLAILVAREVLAGYAVDLDWAAIVQRYAAIGAALYLIAWLVPWSLGQYFKAKAPEKERTYRWTDWFWWTVSGAIFGALVALLGWLYARLPDDWFLPAVVIAGPPAIILAQMMAEICFVGLVSRTQQEDDDREWLARAGGSYVLLAFAGAAFFALVILAPLAYEGAQRTFTAWLVSIGGLAGAMSAALGASKLTAPSAKQDEKGAKRFPVDMIVKLAAPIFGAALIVGASLLLDELLFHGRFEETGLFGEPSYRDPDVTMGTDALRALLLGVVGALAALVFIPWRVNINRFSIHSFYRNRLIRAFLAASRTSDNRVLQRPERNLFTDIDPHDNMTMHELWDRLRAPRGAYWRPFHVVNMALNIVSSRNPAWQERKAEPFTVTPLHAGSGCASFDGPGAFQFTRSYGGAEGYGLSLGTAMAISGAAASPNMGYHSSPAVTFLMALFNVRLGWWLPNPGAKGKGYYTSTGPGWALGPYLAEMFGRTQDDRRFVYLSDGGHFENLGLYEMVRRRCRYIVVSDASQDKDFKFGSLGDAVRKIGIDLGIRVEMIGLDALKKRSEERQTPGEKGPYHAMGLIHYADVDGDGVGDGILLYIKPGLHWVESAGVQNYASTHPTFPHESTGNQWFTESQFESYRRLGLEITWPIVERAVSDRMSYGREVTLADVMEDLRARAVSRGRGR